MVGKARDLLKPNINV